MKQSALLILLFNGCILSLLAQNTNRFYVNTNLTDGENNGLDWDNAFSNLQDAIRLARPGDSIWVAKGTYYPTDNNNRRISFELKPGVVMLGGFVGNEQFSFERQSIENETILSGDIGEHGNKVDNSYHVLYTIGTDSTTIIDGFTITQGHAMLTPGDFFTPSFVIGGGLLVDANASISESAPTIRNCRFIDNQAQYGGAIHCNGLARYYVNPKIENCYFHLNWAEVEGGAIFKSGPAKIDQPQQYINCSFIENYSAAAAVYLSSADNVHIFKNCLFHRDSASFKASAIFHESINDEGATLKIIKCRFEENNNRFDAAIGVSYITNRLNNNHNVEIEQSTFLANKQAILISGRSGTFNVNIQNCDFIDNQGNVIEVIADGNTSANTVINACRFENNRSMSEQPTPTIKIFNLSNGIGFSSARTQISNSLFHHNDGSLELFNRPPGRVVAIVNNCTFFQNGTVPFLKNWQSGFAPDTSFTQIKFQNCIIWEPSLSFDLIFNNTFLEVNSENPLIEYKLEHCLVSTENCNVPRGFEICEAGNLFAVNPHFLDTINYDFRLATCSPLINQGKNIDLDSLGSTQDLLGANRILEDTIDLGAYETIFSNPVIESTIIPVNSAQPFSGSITIDSIYGGLPPYDILWSTNNIENALQNLEAGSYKVTITDAQGCTTTEQFEVSMISVIRNEENQLQVNVFPNPIKNHINLSLTKAKAALFQLCNSQGQVVYSKVLKEGKENYQLVLPNLPNGLYIWNLQTREKEMISGKLVKW